jgi:immune inhibitor A
MSQLYANYKNATQGITLSFRDYLKVIGFPQAMRTPEIAERAHMLAAPAKVTVPRHPISGTLRIIVLLVDFADNAGKRPVHQFEDMLFSRGTYLTGSMREYFGEVSHDKVDVVGSVHGWLRMPQPYTYYVNGRSGLGSYPRNAQRLAEDAVAAAIEQGVVFDRELDKFGNRMVTGLFIVHAGMGAEVMPSVALQKKHIWSHKYEMTEPVDVGPSLSAATYLTVPEDAYMGVCAHELGHLAFQWDDFYDPDTEDGEWAGAGGWDLMAGGSWNNGGNTPAHPAALHKTQHGWVPVEDIGGSTHLVLPPYGDPNAMVARIRGRGFSATQSLLLENRRMKGFDAHLPGTGLLVWRVDTALEMTDVDEAAMLLIQADGKHDLEKEAGKGDAGDPFPGSENTRELLDAGGISTSFPNRGPSGVRLSNIAVDPVTGAIELDVAIA